MAESLVGDINTIDLAQMFGAPSSMRDLSSAFMDLVRPMGMTASACGFVSGPRSSSGDPFYFLNWPEDWIEHYMRSEFMSIDPVVRWARNSGAVLTWSELFKLLPPRDAGRRVIEEGARFGFTEGMAVPMRGADGSIALVSVGGDRTGFDFREREYLKLLCRLVFDAAERLDGTSTTITLAPILTQREVDCLNLLMSGHSDKEIGKLLAMTTRTVRFHLANAREKARASSRPHLVAIAAAQGFINV